MELIWIFIFIAFIVFEAMTVNLITIWLALGALVAGICSLFIDNLIIQILIFLFVTILSLLVTKPFVSKILKLKKEKTNADMVIGKSGKVIKKITHDEYGQVKALGNVWTATTLSKEEIDEGEEIIIKEIQGVKLIVERKEN